MMLSIFATLGSGWWVGVLLLVSFIVFIFFGFILILIYVFTVFYIFVFSIVLCKAP